MYLVALGWLYVALMMAVAEATHSQGSIFGAIVTFVLYGALPVALVMYLLGTPARKRRLREREAAELAEWKLRQAAAGTPSADAPDAGGEAPADPVAPVRKEP